MRTKCDDDETLAADNSLMRLFDGKLTSLLLRLPAWLLFVIVAAFVDTIVAGWADLVEFDLFVRPNSFYSANILIFIIIIILLKKNQHSHMVALNCLELQQL